MCNFQLCILTSALALVACSSNPIKPEPIVVKSYERIVVLPPPELLAVPEQMPRLDVDTAQQSDVAQWILLKEDRCRKIENQLISIGKYLETVK